MTDFLRALQGKKTYIIAFVLAVICFLENIGVQLPTGTTELLSSLGLVAARIGTAKK